ncbi:MAG TPA: ABC transporter ATP-binding protein [Actinomycetota bacterium]|nr:ABC transporter ATP-binding protein [Actinomycetota bacterium]
MADVAVSIRGLRKTYGKVEAVRGIDLDVGVGEVFALLGPNGAGKTTTVEILEGHRKRTAGEVSVLGYDPGRRERVFKQRIGIVLQETGIEPFLTVTEAIDLYRGYYPKPLPIDEILDVVGLTEQRDVLVNKLSGGQQRRLDVAIGLAGDPELLFLDEPTTGFDPAARRKAWTMVENLQSLGKTIFLTTHYMDEAQHLADRVAIIVDGRIVVEGPPQSLGGTELAETRISFVLSTDAPKLPRSLSNQFVQSDGRYELTTSQPEKVLHQLTAWALEKKTTLDNLTVRRGSLEEVYLELTRETEQGPVDE